MYLLLAVEYALPQNDIVTRQEAIYKKVDEIGNSIFKDGMSDEEKVRAIWDYLEANTKYDDAALEAAEASNFTEVLGFEDSFNAYTLYNYSVALVSRLEVLTKNFSKFLVATSVPKQVILLRY